MQTRVHHAWLFALLLTGCGDSVDLKRVQLRLVPTDTSCGPQRVGTLQSILVDLRYEDIVDPPCEPIDTADSLTDISEALSRRELAFRGLPPGRITLTISGFAAAQCRLDALRLCGNLAATLTATTTSLAVPVRCSDTPNFQDCP